MSTTPTSSRCSNDKRATMMATSVRGNISSGNAIQVNGPIAETVCNLHFQNLYISCQCSSVSKLITRSKAPVASNAPRSDSSTLLSMKQIPSLARMVDQPVTALLDGASTNTQVRIENLSFTSRQSKKRQPVRALFQPCSPVSFIDRRIVKRLELVTYPYDRTGKEVSTNHSKTPYVEGYVELPCCPKIGAACGMNRFGVVRDCSFDLVFGADSISPHP